MNSDVLVVNAFIEAAEESLRSDGEYNDVLNALYTERQRFMDAGFHTGTIEGMANGVKIMDCGSTNETGHDTGSIPVRNGLSDRISKDLKKRVFKYRCDYDLFVFTGLRDSQGL